MSASARGLVGVAARRGVYYGWIVAGVGFVLQTVTALASQGLSTYVVPLEREFGWSRTSIGFGRSFQQLDGAFGPFSGSLADRFGARRMMVTGTLIYAAGFIVFSLVQTEWAYYLASALLALGNSCCGIIVMSVATNHWFHRKRTTALGVSFLGYAVSGALLVPALVLSQSLFGWRAGALLSAGFVLLVALPAALLVRNSPERYGLLPDGDAHGSVEAASTAARALDDFTLGEALRARAFWLLAAAGAMAFAAQNAVLIYQFAHIEGMLSREAAAAVIFALNVTNVAGRIVGGWAGDRLPKHVTLALVQAVLVVAVVLLAVATSLEAFIVYGALFGLCWGIRTPVITSVQAEYFGRRSYGRIAGTIQTIQLPFIVAAPVVAGLVADAQQDYRPAFLGATCLIAASVVLFFLATRPRRPAARPEPAAAE